MIDMRIIQIQDVIPLTGVTSLEISPPTLLIKSNGGFNSVSEVFINNSKSPDVVAESDRSLLAQVPDIEEQNFITSVIVTSSKFTNVSKRSKINFSFRPNYPTVSGIERLVQEFVKVMLQSPSTFSNMGGGLLKAAKSSVDLQSIAADMRIAIDKTRSQIIKKQSRSSTIPLEERLQSAYLIDSSFDSSRMSVSGTIGIDNRLSQKSVVGLKAPTS